VARNTDKFQLSQWHTMIMDEAQAIKNSATNRARAMHAIDADFKLGLTGTPLENNTGELWSLMRALVPGLLGSQEKFRKRYQIPIERDGDRAARLTLATLISPFILRRIKSEVAADLPERTDIRVDIELGSSEKKLYEELRRSVLAKISGTGSAEPGEHKRFEILAAITRLRQAACHPKLYHPMSRVKSSKLGVLRERLEAIAEEGYRALVFSQFTSLLALVKEELEGSGLRIAYLDGSMTAKKREQVVEAFQRGEYDVFLLSIKAGGVGLNLTAANTVFLLDPWWNPAVEDQATDRAHRIGQKEPVTVYRLVSQGTIEEAIYELHAEKRSLLDGVLSEAGAIKKALSPDELRALIGS
jgi:SNF2 family DNA or RNA helicase